MAGRALDEILDDCTHGGLLATADGEALAAEIARLRAKLARVRKLAACGAAAGHSGQLYEATDALDDIKRLIDEQP